MTRSFLFRIFALSSVLALPTACGGGTSTNPSDAGLSSSDAAPADASSVADTGPTGPPGVIGVVKDESENVVPNIMVLGCTSSFCDFGKTSGDGHFSFTVDKPTMMIVKTPEIDTATLRRAEAVQPVSIVDQQVDVGTVYQPNLGPGVDLGPVAMDPQTVMLGDGLVLTLKRADLTPALGKNVSNLAARAIVMQHMPKFTALSAETVVAAFALFPFSTTSSSPIAVKFPSTLPAGTAVKLRTIDELDGHFSDPIAGHSDGSFITTDAGQGIVKLSWLVVTR